MTIYSDYSRDRIGWFFGISGLRLALLAAGTLPVFWAVHRSDWPSALLLLAAWSVLLVVTVVPVRGRSALGWVAASLGHAVGSLTSWSSFRSTASTGRCDDLDLPDLPGVLHRIQIHDGPPVGATQHRVAVIQDHVQRSWAVTAAVVHPGIGMDAADARHRYGEALSALLDVAGRTEKIDQIVFTVRTVPDDGAERSLWVQRHRRPEAPPLATAINADLSTTLTQASVRTEQFVTVVVPEARIARSARESGGGVEGRCREFYLLMAEVEAHLVGGMGMTSVRWLSSPELALACRTGFAPGDRAGIVEALGLRDHDGVTDVNADVPWALAGPSGADPVVRHYSHDAWNSVSATIKLPPTGAVMGALAPILTPTEPGERRSFMVAFPIVRASTADRQSGNAEWAADTAEAMRGKLGIRVRAQQRTDAAKARGMDSKLARGSTLTRPYAVCTVTVPKTVRVSEYGRRLDASIRRAGFAPLRLDLAQDTAFAATVVPLGVGLTQRGRG